MSQVCLRLHLWNYTEFVVVRLDANTWYTDNLFPRNDLTFFTKTIMSMTKRTTIWTIQMVNYRGEKQRRNKIFILYLQSTIHMKLVFLVVVARCWKQLRHQEIYCLNYQYKSQPQFYITSQTKLQTRWSFFELLKYQFLGTRLADFLTEHLHCFYM